MRAGNILEKKCGPVEKRAKERTGSHDGQQRAEDRGELMVCVAMLCISFCYAQLYIYKCGARFTANVL